MLFNQLRDIDVIVIQLMEFPCGITQAIGSFRSYEHGLCLVKKVTILLIVYMHY